MPTKVPLRKLLLTLSGMPLPQQGFNAVKLKKTKEDKKGGVFSAFCRIFNLMLTTDGNTDIIKYVRRINRKKGFVIPVGWPGML